MVPRRGLPGEASAERVDKYCATANTDAAKVAIEEFRYVARLGSA
jgi:hypothetical protein